MELNIGDEKLRLKVVIDFGEYLNMLHKDFIPTKQWRRTTLSTTGLGNKSLEMDYEAPRATLCFYHHYIDMRFMLAYLSVAYILGTPFLANVEPHGSCIY